MGLGGTAQKLQKVASMAEDVYAKLNEVRQQLVELNETVDSIDRRTVENRALIERLAEQQGIDVESVLAEAAIEEAEGDGPAGPGADAGAESGSGSGTATGSESGSGSDAASTATGRDATNPDADADTDGQ